MDQPILAAKKSSNPLGSVGFGSKALVCKNRVAQQWTTTSIFVELLVTLIAFFSVIAYNCLFNASISPLLGMLVGAINGLLVAWCMTHSDQQSQETSGTKR